MTTAPPKVLVIDDEPGVRKLMERALSDFYSVLTAADGQEGLTVARRAQPQLVILDLHLPDIDGLTVLARLKADRQTQLIPVVIASVRGETDLLFQAQQAGAADQLIKPFTVQDLRETVKRNVRFDFPDSAKHSPATVRPTVASGLSRPTVLVIDDEEGIQRLIQKVLEPAYSVMVASTGQEGLHWASAALPQIILLDIHLPELDGLSVLARLKAQPRTARIPVVIISIRGASDTLMEGQRAGAVDYLIKPFHPDTLLAMVQRHVMAE